MTDPDRTFTRAKDPRNRCQALGGAGQCPFEKIEGTEYCARHQGGTKWDADGSARKYTLAKWQEKFEYKADNPKIKELNEEIAILQMTLETRINNCEDETALLMHASQITTLVREVAIVTEKWHKIQMQTNAVMDRAQAMLFIQALGEIIDAELADIPNKETVLKRIGDKMVEDLNRRTGTGLRENLGNA